MSFLGHPLPSDRAGYQPSSHVLYLFQKYLGYDPNKSKEENYRHSTNLRSSSNSDRSSNSRSSNSKSSAKEVTQRIKYNTKKDNIKPKLNSNLKPTLIGLSLGLIGLLTFLIIKRLKLK